MWMNVKKTQENTGAHSSWSSSIFVTTALLLRGSSGNTLRSSTVYQTWPAQQAVYSSDYAFQTTVQAHTTQTLKPNGT